MIIAVAISFLKIFFLSSLNRAKPPKTPKIVLSLMIGKTMLASASEYAFRLK
jgi:hypothetical protein